MSRTAASTLLAAALILFGAAPVYADARTSPDHVIHYSDQAMGTIVNLTFWCDDEALAARGAKAVFDEFRRVDELMSSWRDGSDVARINAAAGRRGVKVSDEIFKVLSFAQKISKKTGGAFDVTVGSFRGLWKFDQDRDGTIPDPDAVKERLKVVGYRGVRLNARRKVVKLRKKGTRITLGGIAKGYAVDRAVEILHKMNLVDFIVQAGGDLYVSGRRGDRKWRVGIRDPRGPRDATFAIAEIKDRTFSTSGDYERFVLKDGVRYHHILDPATGRPADRSRSVTVMAKNALTADAWSTSLFVLGAQKGLKLVEKTPDLEAVFVDADNKVHVSSGLKDVVVVYKQPTPGP